MSQVSDFSQTVTQENHEWQDIEKMQMDLDRLGEWAVENEMKINPGKSKAVSFTRARVKDSLESEQL